MDCHVLLQKYNSPQELLKNSDGQDSGPDRDISGFQNTIAYYVPLDPLAQPSISCGLFMSLIPD